MMNRLKDILYRVVLYVAMLGPRQKGNKKALIVKTDEIGDYILWRKFIEPIATSALLKGYKIDFVGNQSWRQIAELLDTDFFDRTFWVDKIKFKKDVMYRYRFLRKLYLTHYDVVIDPLYSRDPRYDEAMVEAAKARLRLGMNRNTENVRNYEMKKRKNLFNRTFVMPQFPVFEFYRNKAFAEYVCGREVKITDNLFDTEKFPEVSGLPERYFVVFPGSRNPARIWSTANFLSVADYLALTYGLTAVVCGSNADKPYCDAFVAQYGHFCVDITGKTGLAEMLSVLKKAQCLLSVDTGAVHMAAAVGCRVYGIFNGSQYGRFSPYPPGVAKAVVSVYPDEVEKEVMDMEQVQKKYTFTTSVSYDNVPAEKVLERIKETLRITNDQTHT